jgi:predicted nucleic acid-binding protein
MARFIFLDSGPLGLACNSPKKPATRRFQDWAAEVTSDDRAIVIPEIIDYEIRREIIRLNHASSLDRLNDLREIFLFEPLNSRTLERAAEFWAMARRRGKPTADPQALDCDVILAAQASLIAERGHQVTVATTNVRHLSLFVDARDWATIA